MSDRSKYFLKRFLQMIMILWVIATILFFMFRLMPGNPLAAYIDPTFTVEQQEILMQQFGLDKPLYQQYFIYIGNIAQGNFGESFFYRDSVINLVLRVLPNTLYLTMFSLILAYLYGISYGILLAWKRGTKFETFGIVTTLLTRAAPQFWIGMVLLAIFSFKFGFFPSAGTSGAGVIYNSELEKLVSIDFWKHLFLPGLTLFIYLQGLPLLLMRSNMLDVMNEAYVDMAKMRGLNNFRIMFKYTARNAILPIVTAMAVGVGYAIGGNVIIENVFSWPGIGKLLVDAVSSNDYPLAQGAFFLIATVMIFMNFVADILYNLLDPRVSVGKGGK